MIREGSLALGATKSETLWKVVLPMASPAMMTGLILAVARAAGEVAPLMLVGVVKLAPNLPLNGNYPYLHLDQKIMHLGFHIYDVGFQSPNVEAARPLVYATALLLVLVIATLNFSAIYIRNHLREIQGAGSLIGAASRIVGFRGKHPARMAARSLQPEAANGASTCKPPPIRSTSRPWAATSAA